MKPMIVILLGEENTGKSATLIELFNIRTRKLLHIKQLKNNVVYIYGKGSPQELSDFCIVKQVMEKIDKRIQRCMQYHENSRYTSKKMTVLIPFTIQKKKGKLNTKCILIPLKKLRKKYKVKVIYLEKRDKALEELINKTNPKYTIVSYENEEKRQSRELLRLL